MHGRNRTVNSQDQEDHASIHSSQKKSLMDRNCGHKSTATNSREAVSLQPGCNQWLLNGKVVRCRDIPEGDRRLLHQLPGVGVPGSFLFLFSLPSPTFFSVIDGDRAVCHSQRLTK